MLNLLHSVAWAVAGGLALWCLNLSSQLGTAELTITALTEERAVDLALLASQSASLEHRSNTIVTLRTQLAECAGKNQDLQRAADGARRLLVNRTAERDKALARLQAERNADYATDPTAEAWRAAVVPGPVSDRLRIQWADAMHEGGDRRHLAGSDRGAGAAAGSGAGRTAGAADAQAIAAAGACTSPAGCYSNGQLVEAVDEAIRSRGQCIDQLAAISEAQRAAALPAVGP